MAKTKGRRYITKSAGPPPRPSSEAVSRSMRSNRGSGTKPELVLAKLLRRKLVRSKLPGSPDFAYPRAKLAVFCHGDWWHSNPVHTRRLPKTHRAYWARKFARNAERDQLVREELEAMGWRVLVVWESQVRADSAGVAARVRELATSQRL